MLQLPESFLQEMRELLGDEYDAWEKSYEYNEGFRGLRVNTGKLRPEEFQALSAFSLRAVPWTRNGFYLEEQAQASKHPYYAAGLYYLQEPSAMTPAACLPIEEGDRVLDLCAAPGGKATELAAKLRERRRLLDRRGLWPSPERSDGVRALLLSCAIGSSSNQVCLQAQPQTMLSVSVSSRSTRLSWGSVGTLSWSTALRHMPTRKPLKCSSQRS